jgi:hypothetical protein
LKARAKAAIGAASKANKAKLRQRESQGQHSSRGEASKAKQRQREMNQPLAAPSKQSPNGWRTCGKKAYWA